MNNSTPTNKSFAIPNHTQEQAEEIDTAIFVREMKPRPSKEPEKPKTYKCSQCQTEMIIPEGMTIQPNELVFCGPECEIEYYAERNPENINPEKPENCKDCRSWAGVCLKGRKGVIAASPACESPDSKRLF